MKWFEPIRPQAENKYTSLSFEELYQLVDIDYSFEQFVWNAWLKHIYKNDYEVRLGDPLPFSSPDDFQEKYEAFLKDGLEFMNKILEECVKDNEPEGSDE